MQPDNPSSARLILNMGNVSAGERNRLVIENAPMVREIAAEYRGARGIPFEDMQAEGMLGLVVAARGFNPHIGKFAPYAAECIRNFIRGLIRNWQPMVSVHDPDSDTTREFWEWSIWAYAAPFEQWTSLAATPEEIYQSYSEIEASRQAIFSAMIGLDPLSRAVMRARFFREPNQALHSIAREYDISYSKTVRIIDRSLKKIRETIARRIAA